MAITTDSIAYLWASKIISGDREYSSVPAKLVDRVDKELIRLGREDLIVK